MDKIIAFLNLSRLGESLRSLRKVTCRGVHLLNSQVGQFPNCRRHSAERASASVPPRLRPFRRDLHLFTLTLTLSGCTVGTQHARLEQIIPLASFVSQREVTEIQKGDSSSSRDSKK